MSLRTGLEHWTNERNSFTEVGEGRIYMVLLNSIFEQCFHYFALSLLLKLADFSGCVFFHCKTIEMINTH